VGKCVVVWREEEKKRSNTAVKGESRAHSCEQLFCSLFLHTGSGAQPVHYNWDISLGNKDNTKASQIILCSNAVYNVFLAFEAWL